MDRRNLIVDIAALAAYLVVANPALTGIGLHEWLGLGVFVAFFVHLLLHADWAVEALRGSFSHPSWGRTGNLALDLLIVLVFMAATVSGVMVSGAVLPALGLYAEGYYFWDPLHAMSAKALLALLLVHVVVHWKWIARFLKKGRDHE
ncbi:hypothetical protein B5F40_05080 [Gordonibacter sp. An230]|uniref:DUF4405 domain-containing protein n=1 Tax=Gordonibacter sp. An230 TaxID=1965592 RepID=UPI000B3B06A7|nr:DUF4405 domain-containing protein [Gordonibacter sp. An230]OUO90840.1 hypothetical protein B5F40_05080 [Gordonibacter sp. An230]